MGWQERSFLACKSDDDDLIRILRKSTSISKNVIDADNQFMYMYESIFLVTAMQKLLRTKQKGVSPAE